MAEHRKADDVLHEKSGELVIAGGGDDGVGQVESFGSRVSVCSSKSSLMVEDDHDEVDSSLMMADPTTKSSSFAKRLAEHQLDELSPLLAKLSVRHRTGLSRCYQGKSQSFTNLSLVKGLAKKTTTYSTRMKICRREASAGLGTNRSSIGCHLFGTRTTIITKKPRRSSSVKSNGQETPPYKGKK